MLLAGIPDLLRVIVLDALGRANDIRVVAEVPSLASLDAMRGDVPADVVIAGLHNDELPEAALRLLYAQQTLTVLAIVLASGEAQLWQMRPQCTRLYDVTPEKLLDAVRAAATGRDRS
ncbi:MAG: hypothetical protein ABI852_20040 [Gemmatimonadaceae bacterium]